MTDTFPRTEHTNQPQQGGSHPAPLPPLASTAFILLHTLHFFRLLRLHYKNRYLEKEQKSEIANYVSLVYLSSYFFLLNLMSKSFFIIFPFNEEHFLVYLSVFL